MGTQKHLYNIWATPAQRLRRWSSIVQMLYKCFVFTETGPISKTLLMFRYINTQSLE